MGIRILSTSKENMIVSDIHSELFKDRIVFVIGQVSSEMAEDVNSQLLYLEKLDPKAPIKMIIDSPGGSVVAGQSIQDTMDNVSCQVHTECLGMAASMGSILFMNGAKGFRLINKNSRVLLHQPLIGGHIPGQATDLEIQADSILKMRTKLFQFIADKTGKKIEQINKDCDRDFWLDAEEAVAYGCADGFVKSRKIESTSKKGSK